MDENGLPPNFCISWKSDCVTGFVISFWRIAFSKIRETHSGGREILILISSLFSILIQTEIFEVLLIFLILPLEFFLLVFFSVVVCSSTFVASFLLIRVENYLMVLPCFVVYLMILGLHGVERVEKNPFAEFVSR